MATEKNGTPELLLAALLRELPENPEAEPGRVDDALEKWAPRLAELPPTRLERFMRELATRSGRGLSALKSLVTAARKKRATPSARAEDAGLYYTPRGEISGADPQNFVCLAEREWPGGFGFDAFRRQIRILGKTLSELSSGNVEDHHIGWLRGHFARSHGVLFGEDTAWAGLLMLSKRATFNPVADYLNALRWDGTSRCDRLWMDYFGALPIHQISEAHDTEKQAYLETTARVFLVAAVARVLRPGCKVDTMPVLEGRQGIRKSTGLRALVTGSREAEADGWFSDQLPSMDRDGMMSLQGKWVIEQAELDALSRSEVTRIRGFLSQQTDRYRPPWGRATQEFPRQCVLIGTTNEDQYLRDSENRRFYPIRCGGAVDVEAILRDRDQLWAEAIHRFKAGEQWYLLDTHERIARGEQGLRQQTDPWNNEEVLRWLEGRLSVSTSELLTSHLKIDRGKQTRSDEMRAAAFFKGLKWWRDQVPVLGLKGKREWRYFPPKEEP